MQRNWTNSATIVASRECIECGPRDDYRSRRAVFSDNRRATQNAPVQDNLQAIEFVAGFFQILSVGSHDALRFITKFATLTLTS